MQAWDAIKDTFFDNKYTIGRTPIDFQTVFTKDIETKAGIFTVQFSNIKPEEGIAPKARIISLPENTNISNLPHREADNSICYFDEATSNLDPIKPAKTIATCIYLVELIIESWATGNYQDDIHHEFGVYWCGQATIFELSKTSQSTCYWYNKLDLADTLQGEYVVADHISNFYEWMERRPPDEKKDFASCTSIAIRVPSFSIDQNRSWPPNSFQVFIDWLSITNKDALDNLIGKLVNIVPKSWLVILVRGPEETIGLRVAINSELSLTLNRAKNRNKKNGSYRAKDIQKSLCSPLMTSNFKRFSVEDTSPDFLFQRNLPENETLLDKKIALIGCGTIGGYTALSLAQVGAGAGTGSITYYDSDRIKPSNLGRHILGIKYIDEVKSYALKDYIKKLLLPITIEASTAFRKIDMPSHWDIIIDATGSQTFSAKLAYWHRQMLNTTTTPRPPILVHGWIDGYGAVSRVLRDSGKGACYYCLSDFMKTERFPVFNENNKPNNSHVYRKQCGDSYLPFTSEASMAAAGLIQRVVLAGVEGPSFIQQSFSSTVINTKPKTPDSSKSCPICSP
jgi:hypothetical protein